MKVADNIKNYRKKAGLTQKQLAEKTGLSIATIQGYEQGKYLPKIEQLQKIANVLNVHALVLNNRITEDYVKAITRNDIGLESAYVEILKAIYGGFDITNITLDSGYTDFAYILGDDDEDKIIISSLTYDNLSEAIEFLIELSVNISVNNNDAQEVWRLIYNIKDMNITELRKLIEYAKFLKTQS